MANTAKQLDVSSSDNKTAFSVNGSWQIEINQLEWLKPVPEVRRNIAKAIPRMVRRG